MPVYVWTLNEDSTLTKAALEQPTALTTDDGPTLLLVPIAPLRDAVAACMVPDDCAEDGFCNDMPLAAGLHCLRHGDQLAWHERLYWIALETTPSLTHYDPNLHGSDAYCFLTKTRLAAGEPIVVCPGSAQQRCGALYKQQAWELSLQGPRGMRCANCGFDSRQAAWQPTPPSPAPTLEHLKALLPRKYS